MWSVCIAFWPHFPGPVLSQGFVPSHFTWVCHKYWLKGQSTNCTHKFILHGLLILICQKTVRWTRHCPSCSKCVHFSIFNLSCYLTLLSRWGNMFLNWTIGWSGQVYNILQYYKEGANYMSNIHAHIFTLPRANWISIYFKFLSFTSSWPF